MVIDRVSTGAADDDVSAAIAIKRVGSRAARDRVGVGRARNGDGAGDCAGVDIQEAFYDRGAGGRLIQRIGQIQADDGFENQRARRAGAAIDRCFRSVEIDHVRAGAANDHVSAAIAVDRVGARAARDRIVARRSQDRDRRSDRCGIHIDEASHQRRAARLVHAARKIDVRRRVQDQRRQARTCRNRRFRSVIIDQIGARSADDDVRAPVAVDRGVA